MPQFRYHPDPAASGVIEPSEAVCIACNRARGHIYTGPVYSDGPEELNGAICPWCIADGSAAARFDAVFSSTGYDEIDLRTPGFVAWQEEEWLTCCGEPAIFLGPAGARELRKELRPARAAVKAYIEDNYGVEGDELKEFLDGLSKDDQPTAYVFLCPACQEYLAYVDQT